MAKRVYDSFMCTQCGVVSSKKKLYDVETNE